MMKLISLLVAMIVSMTGCSDSTSSVEQLSPSTSSIETISSDKNVSRGQSSMDNGITLTLKATYKGFQSPTGIAVDNSGNLYVMYPTGVEVPSLKWIRRAITAHLHKGCILLQEYPLIKMVIYW